MASRTSSYAADEPPSYDIATLPSRNPFNTYPEYHERTRDASSSTSSFKIKPARHTPKPEHRPPPLSLSHTPASRITSNSTSRTLSTITTTSTSPTELATRCTAQSQSHSTRLRDRILRKMPSSRFDSEREARRAEKQRRKAEKKAEKKEREGYSPTWLEALGAMEMTGWYGHAFIG